MQNLRGWRPENVAVVPAVALGVSLLFLVLLLVTGVAGGESLRGPGAAAFAAGLAAMTLAQCARRRFPAGGYLCTVLVTACLVASIGDLGFTPLYWISIVSLAIRVSGRTLAVTALAGMTVDVLVSGASASSWTVPTINIVVSYTVLLTLGKVIAHNRSQVARSSAALEKAVEEERRTMARELHDVAAHHLTAMIIQARAADKLLDTDPYRSQELLREVVVSGQRTLDGLRQIVGILRFSSEEDAPPQPMIADIPNLIEQSRHSLDSVALDLGDGTENLDSAVQLACYRIVQESLANAMRHAPGSRVQIQVTRRHGSLDLTVADTGGGVGTGASDGQGFGIAGMRERAALLGGRLVAGPAAGGGWEVTARMPVDGRIAS